MLPMLFFGTGALLMKLRQHALEANECHDLEVEAAKAASLLKTCCGGNTANNSAGGGVGAIGDGAMMMASSGEDEDEKMSCKFCDEDAACRFCFAGPEKGELIAPCACVGSQEFVHTACLRQWQKIAMRTKAETQGTSIHKIAHVFAQLKA